MSNSQTRTINAHTAFHDMLAQYHTVRVAGELGVLRALANGQKTSAQMAELLGLDAWKTELLLSALVHTGLVERYEEDFALSQFGRMIPLDRPVDELWGDLAASLKIPTPDVPPRSDAPDRPPLADSWTQTPAALDAAEVLDIGRSRRAFRIAEVGAGAAVFSTAFAHRDPDCRVTLLDNPEGLELARQTTDGIGVTGQFEFIEGDYRAPALPEDAFDMVIAVGLLRYFRGGACQEWIGLLAAALKPEGELVLVDWFYGQEKGDRTLAFGELALASQVSHARIQSPPVVRTWMIDSGLENIQFAFLPAAPHTWGLIIGQKQ